MLCHTSCDLDDTDQWNSSLAFQTNRALGTLSYGGGSLAGTGRDPAGKRCSLVIQCCVYFGIAPSQPPGNIIWNSSDSKIILNWDQVKALDNESEVRGYKVSILSAQAAGQHCPAPPPSPPPGPAVKPHDASAVAGFWCWAIGNISMNPLSSWGLQ